MSQFLYIAIGAAFGANARYLVGLWAAGRLGTGYPHGTWIVNITGSFLLGFVLALTTDRISMSPNMRLLLTVGFLGSYTTFSTYAVESVGLWRDIGWWAGFGNMLLHNGIGLLFVVLGTAAARWLAGWGGQGS